ncbi:MAG TPA: ornithine cyclodeaminase family protein [Symbiobacteriaceae bacterium]|nr:ornithine cyclodeaminase family protein [Symbiobacteriaceae bacterium]
MAQIRYVTDEELQELCPIPRAIELVEAGFRATARGGAHNFPVVRELIGEHEGIFGVKSGFLPAAGVLGLKAGGYWLQNPRRHGVGAHQSTVLLFHPESGQLKGVLAANYLTGLRTGAAGAVAARALARPGSRRAGLIGTGVQAEMQLRCLAAVFSLERAQIWSADPYSMESFTRRTAGLGVTVEALTDPEPVVRGADILVTTTPAFKPVVRAEWLQPGVHVNAIGADTKGKQELETGALLKADRVVVDSVEQAAALGELQHPVGAGLLDKEQVYTLGEVLEGLAPGRPAPEAITIFDATGLIMQDLVVADYVWKRAHETAKGGPCH